MKISSGELYGNRIPISLPADARYFSAQLEKVVFDDGEVWDALNKSTCKLLQKEIKVPEDIREKIRRELEILVPYNFQPLYDPHLHSVSELAPTS